MNDRPADLVLKAFDLSRQKIEPLKGGTGQSWIAGNIVLKPCYDEIEWHWMADILPEIIQNGFRLPMPVCARNGHWVVDGWCAQVALQGEHPEYPRDGRWLDVIEVGEKFHKAAAHLTRPDFLDSRDHGWALGDRIAWEEVRSSYDYYALHQMLELRKPLNLSQQIIHGDLSENILFSEDLPPAIIDFTPYWRPAEFATAIVIADAVCWRNADPEIFHKYITLIEHFPQLFIRALIFRMIATIAASHGNADLSGFTPGINMVMDLIK